MFRREFFKALLAIPMMFNQPTSELKTYCWHWDGESCVNCAKCFLSKWLNKPWNRIIDYPEEFKEEIFNKEVKQIIRLKRSF